MVEKGYMDRGAFECGKISRNSVGLHESRNALEVVARRRPEPLVIIPAPDSDAESLFTVVRQSYLDFARACGVNELSTHSLLFCSPPSCCRFHSSESNTPYRL